MSDDELRKRLRRIYAALGDVSGSSPEDAKPTMNPPGSNTLHANWNEGRTDAHLEKDAYTVINEIMGLKDRTRAWLKARGKAPDEVEKFLTANREAALIHDLANADKHGQGGSSTLSGLGPILKDVTRAITLKRDPASGKYPSSGTVKDRIDFQTGEVKTVASSGTEVVLTGLVQDKDGKEICHLHDLLFHALRAWEDFLDSQGLTVI